MPNLANTSSVANAGQFTIACALLFGRATRITDMSAFDGSRQDVYLICELALSLPFARLGRRASVE
jgi:hypothetical protein